MWTGMKTLFNVITGVKTLFNVIYVILEKTVIFRDHFPQRVDGL